MCNSCSIDVLAISSACHTAINRKVYSDMLSAGSSVVIVVPTEMSFGNTIVKADAPRDGDPDVIYLKLVGSNARMNYFVGIFNVIKKYSPKYIVIDNDPASIMVLQIAIFSKIINKANIFCISYENLPLTLHSSYTRRGFSSVIPLIYKKFILALSKTLITGLFVVNDDGHQIFKSNGIKNICKIPLGFDSNYFKIDNESRIDTRKHLGVENKFVIGYFGRISHEKGVHILLAALSRLLEYDWILLIDEFDRYHNSYAKTIYDQIDNEGLSDRVIYSSPSHNNIGKFMNAVDVVVMPSITTPVWIEQYGRVAPEAMACGKIVIASNTGALPMLLNGHGLLFDEGNINDLTNKLTDIIVGSDRGLLFSPQEISDYAHKSLNTVKQAKSMLTFMGGI